MRLSWSGAAAAATAVALAAVNGVQGAAIDHAACEAAIRAVIQSLGAKGAALDFTTVASASAQAILGKRGKNLLMQLPQLIQSYRLRLVKQTTLKKQTPARPLRQDMRSRQQKDLTSN